MTTTMPKLKLKWWGRWEKIVTLSEAETVIPFNSTQPLAVLVAGRQIHSYEELVRLAQAEAAKGTECIEVAVVMPMSGG